MYNKPVLCASAGNSCPRTHSRAAYTRAAVLAEFGTRDARALDQGYFVDRKPHERPHRPPASWRRETNGPKRIELADLIGQVDA